MRIVFATVLLLQAITAFPFADETGDTLKASIVPQSYMVRFTIDPAIRSGDKAAVQQTQAAFLGCLDDSNVDYEIRHKFDTFLAGLSITLKNPGQLWLAQKCPGVDKITESSRFVMPKSITGSTVRSMESFIDKMTGVDKVKKELGLTGKGIRGTLSYLLRRYLIPFKLVSLIRESITDIRRLERVPRLETKAVVSNTDTTLQKMTKILLMTVEATGRMWPVSLPAMTLIG